LVWHGSGISSSAGTPTDFGRPFLEPSTVSDEDGNGLPDDIDEILGSGPRFDFGTSVSPVYAGYNRVTPYFRRQAIAEIVRSHETSEQNHGYRLWNLLILEKWLRRWT
jgi:hypothetical protein